ncbi:hypothetical protein [Planctomonas psychrotolerans]|uniref:hypothetical protein n=1 Tax=Planctomonas psychrotolerans TaxID=2528712 RepID=UPI001D0D10A1|nr:hypothetical protein [Planctomonas psychrotolerans]
MTDTTPLDPRLASGIEKILSVQRPVVLSHIRALRRKHPGATPEQIIAILERRYLTAVTTGGAAVGASAVVPGVGMGISLALSGAETAGFLEATALFAQSVTEVHGIAVEDPERARALVMTMMLGSAGSDLVRQLAGQAAGKSPELNRFWGQTITSGLPQFAVGPVADRIKRAFIKRFAVRQGSNVLGRAIPFGIGAVIGGTGNHMLGRKVVASSREAFGPPTAYFPMSLAIEPPMVVTEAEVKPKRRGPLALLPGRGSGDTRNPKNTESSTPRPENTDPENAGPENSP